MQTEWNFDYINAMQSVELKPGKYKFECWGASGGAYKANSFADCAKGGYSKGEITLKEKTIFYICVGQSGFEKFSSANGNGTRTGYNGGGKGSSMGDSSGRWSTVGGGATDIRLIDGSWDNPQSLLSRIIVAGGGGSTSENAIEPPYSSRKGGSGGGEEGGRGIGMGSGFTSGGTQYQGGTAFDVSYKGSFGKGSGYSNVGGGGGWFGGACSTGSCGSSGGSGYTLTKDSYKPVGYIPTPKYYLENVGMATGGNTTKADGYAKITLLQALPFLNISSYNSTTATFKADHTDPTLLTKIEYFIDDILKETITTDLTTEKTINYTLEDNALHTLKIVVTDSNNATAEKVLSISKNIMPLPGENVNLNDISTKLTEVNAGFKNGKTSIINTLALKNIEASLNNTLVELSEKIKTSFDSSDASVQELQNQITTLNNQLSQRKRWAKGTYDQSTIKSETTRIIMNLPFKPTIIIVNCGITFSWPNSSSSYCYIKFVTNLSVSEAYEPDSRRYSGLVMANITDVSSSSFTLKFTKVRDQGIYEYSTLYGTNFTWLAIE
ncbi:glycine rich domain-containing protein [Clostridioides difficile]|nr:glycine rich domain-containing protein [Clostridioides difficile]